MAGVLQDIAFRTRALNERCQRRQQKLDGLEAWYFSTILATLPIFLQLSLLFFGIALAADIWTLQHTVASVIVATTAFGVIFYFFTIVSSLKSQDCPFQTPISTLLQHLRVITPFRTVVRKNWRRRQKIWTSFRNHLRDFSRRTLYLTKDQITHLITRFVVYLSQIPSTLRQVRSTSIDPETALRSEQSRITRGVELSTAAAGEQTGASEELNLRRLELSVEMAQAQVVQSSAVQWILETSTDTDNITAAAEMVPEIEWPAAKNVTRVLDRLKSHTIACFDPTRQILPHAQARAVVYLKAMCHLNVQQDLGYPFRVFKDGEILFTIDHTSYHMLPDQAFLVVCCALKSLVSLDIASLPLSDRMWMAQMFTYRLYKGNYRPKFVTLTINLIGICLGSKSPARLVADCILLAGMLMGVQVNRQYLALLDKSEASRTLRESVMYLTLDALVGDSDNAGRRQTALKLVYPLLQDFVTHISYFKDRRMSELTLKLCFRFLEEDSGTMMKNQVRFKTIALLSRIVARRMFWYPKDWCTPAQFDLLVDYHLRGCEGRDYDTVKYTFMVLWGLGGSPSTLDRMRRYIDTMIRFMGQETTRVAALRAAFAVRSVIASVGRDDESLRECFSKALASAVLSGATVTQTPLDDIPFKKISFFNSYRDRPYLKLLCTLSQERTWHPQLHQIGHFDNSLAIADTLTSQKDARFDDYAVHVAHIFGVIDTYGEEHPFFSAVQSYPCWPLVLRAWRYIFCLRFFGGDPTHPFQVLSTTDCLAALPSIVAYARRQCDNREESLLALVEQVCHKLDEETQQREHADAQHVRDSSFGHRGIPVLGIQVRELLKVSRIDATPVGALDGRMAYHSGWSEPI